MCCYGSPHYVFAAQAKANAFYFADCPLGAVHVQQESKARLASHPSIIPQLVSLLQPGCGEQLQCGVLRLLHNLSFDGALRQQMMAAGLVQQVRGEAAPVCMHAFLAQNELESNTLCRAVSCHAVLCCTLSDAVLCRRDRLCRCLMPAGRRLWRLACCISCLLMMPPAQPSATAPALSTDCWTA